MAMHPMMSIPTTKKVAAASERIAIFMSSYIGKLELLALASEPIREVIPSASGEDWREIRNTVAYADSEQETSDPADDDSSHDCSRHGLG